VNWGERCSRCGILFDSGSFLKAASGVCEACEREMIAEKEIFQGQEGNPKSGNEERFSPLQLLEKWKELLSSLPPYEVQKLRKEWLDATRARLNRKERRLLNKIQKRLKIKGLGKVSVLLLVAQLGILFEEFDYG